MKVLLDTSVLVAAMVEAHPAHEKSLPWLQRIKRGTDSGLVSAHSIAELYAILTTLPMKPRISPVVAYDLIQRNVFDLCEVAPLTAEDYGTVTKHLSEEGITGGVTYDTVILYAAIKGKADRIVTLNESDFRRIYPQIGRADHFPMKVYTYSEPRQQFTEVLDIARKEKSSFFGNVWQSLRTLEALERRYVVPAWGGYGNTGLVITGLLPVSRTGSL